MKRIVFTVFIVALTGIILQQCQRNGKKPGVAKASNQPHQVDTGFYAMSRQAQVMECARCHQQQYENEMRGPHANAYKMLHEHAEYVNQPKYECTAYKDYINRSVETECTGCHATQNLYETYYEAHLRNPDSMIVAFTAGQTPKPPVRTDKKTYATGVDCLTCHFDGQSVITNIDFKATPGASPDYCSPKGSKIFSSGYNCVACHFSDMTNDHQLYYPAYKANTNTCLECHQQYDAQGKGTHYFYWRYDSVNYPKPAALTSYYKLNPVTRKGNKVITSWQNRAMPHQMGTGPENVMVIKVVDKNKKVWAERKVQMNRKTEHDKNMHGTLGQDLPGTAGVSPIYGETKIDIEIELPANAPKSNLSLNYYGISKAQYWVHDSIGVVQYENTVAIP